MKSSTMNALLFCFNFRFAIWKKGKKGMGMKLLDEVR